jgi:hypothetical protein
MFHRIEHVLRAGTGTAVQGATVTVYLTGTTTKAQLYATNDTSQPIANPVTTDANGRYAYFIEDGNYDETLQYGSVTASETFIQMFDLSGGGGGGDASLTVVPKSATYSETAVSGEVVILCTGTFTINLPTAVGNEAKITAKCLAGAVTLDPAGAETIDGGATAVVNVVGASITIVSDGANWEIV